MLLLPDGGDCIAMQRDLFLKPIMHDAACSGTGVTTAASQCDWHRLTFLTVC